MNIYDITIEIVKKKSYLVEADSLDVAQTKALEAAIKEHPGCDVWLEGSRRR